MNKSLITISLLLLTGQTFSQVADQRLTEKLSDLVRGFNGEAGMYVKKSEDRQNGFH